MQEMTREYVFTLLREEHLWEKEIGKTEKFTVALSQKWEFILKREEEKYYPYKYCLEGKKLGTNERVGRRYVSMEAVFLHIINNFNDNANVKDKYKKIEEWLLKSSAK